MKLTDIYQAAIEAGIKNDPRGEKEIKRLLGNEKKKYEKLAVKEKAIYDPEKLSNPYADSRISYDSGEKVQGVLAGIDIDTAEMLLADRLREKGEKINAVIAHHPVGLAYAKFYEVMDMQADIFASFGVPISATEDLTEKRKKDVGDKVMASNHFKTVDAARLLNFSLMNFHTPADNCVASYLQARINKEKPADLDAIIGLLMEEKEYSEAAKRGAGPVILVGSKDRRVKKAVVDMTGGTEGSKEIFAKLSSAGVDTLVGMHFSDEHKKAIQAASMNAIVAGHIASDNLGVNIVLDYVEKKHGALKVYECGGFIRVKRGKK